MSAAGGRSVVSVALMRQACRLAFGARQAWASCTPFAEHLRDLGSAPLKAAASNPPITAGLCAWRMFVMRKESVNIAKRAVGSR